MTKVYNISKGILAVFGVFLVISTFGAGLVGKCNQESGIHGAAG